jgi:polysaccharide export outer membrane protein
VPYYKDVSQKADSVAVISNYKPMLIQKNDLLGIYVSSLSQEASALFNYNLMGIPGVTTSTSPVTGFLVNDAGEIQLPFLGKLRVEGMSTANLQDSIQKQLGAFLKEPVVNVRVLNFKISVLGDVMRPGQYPIQNERISINDALALAGDMTITARRDNILLVREEAGERKYIRLDINTKELINSPYYYLHNNDVLYIQPGKVKYDVEGNTYRNLSLLLSTISVMSVILLR